MSTNVYLAGDSTVQEYGPERDPQAGWGQYIHLFLKDSVKVHNHAMGGRSSRTFIEEGRLDKIDQQIQAGDYLFIQMGHNDSSKQKPERYTEPNTEYKNFLSQYIDTARRHDATPIFITPVSRLRFESGNFTSDLNDYVKAMKEVAKEEQVVLLDLHDRSIELYESLGYEGTFHLFLASVLGEDFTHFTHYGAKTIAKLVATLLKEKDLGILLKEKS